MKFMPESTPHRQSADQARFQRRKDVLVIIPAYNEEGSIGEVVAGVQSSTPFADVLVINDGSMDNTAAVARRYGAHVLDLPHNLGIGGAISAGFALADEMGYPCVVRMDGDGQHSAEDIARLLEPVLEGRTDVAFGSRFLGRVNSYRPPFARRLGIRMFGLVVSLIIGQEIGDATSGLWCANRRAVGYLARVFPQDYPEVESHILIHKAGLRQMEVPVTMHARIAGHSSIGLMQSVYYAFKVLLAALLRAVQEVPTMPEELAYAGESAIPGYSD